MIGGMIALATYGIGTGGAAGNFLFELEQLGVFSYVLPFLMIFAIIYAILSNMTLLGRNQAINIILALAVSLMALQFNFVSYFFAEIFPRMGVVLSLLLVAIILLGLFVDFTKEGWRWGFGIPLFVAFILIMLQSLEVFNWSFGGFGGGFYWFEVYFSEIITFVIVVATIAAIVMSGGKKRKKKKESDDE